MGGGSYPGRLAFVAVYVSLCLAVFVMAESRLAHVAAGASLLASAGAFATAKLASAERQRVALTAAIVALVVSLPLMLFLEHHFGGSALSGGSHFLDSGKGNVQVTPAVYSLVAAAEMLAAIVWPAGLFLGGTEPPRKKPRQV